MRKLAFVIAALIASPLVLAQSSSLPQVQMPFVRSGDAFALPVTTQPVTYAIVQPANTASYRGVNQCSADIMIKSVSAIGPVTTQPITYGGLLMPSVQQVTSQTEAVTPFQGTLFLARTAETLGSFPNPVAGPIRYVSIMALSDPGGPCLFRLGYGNGG